MSYSRLWRPIASIPALKIVRLGRWNNRNEWCDGLGYAWRNRVICMEPIGGPPTHYIPRSGKPTMPPPSENMD